MWRFTVPVVMIFCHIFRDTTRALEFKTNHNDDVFSTFPNGY